jgi:hypothetical protein
LTQDSPDDRQLQSVLPPSQVRSIPAGFLRIIADHGAEANRVDKPEHRKIEKQNPIARSAELARQSVNLLSGFEMRSPMDFCLSPIPFRMN